MVNRIETEGRADRLLNRDQTQEPTAHAPEFPESPGDRERGKFRPSFWRRLTQIAVSNDDGGPVTEKTDAVLSDILARLDSMEATLKPFGVVSIDGVTTVSGKTVRIGPLGIPGVGAAVAYTANDAFGTLQRIEVPASGIIQSVRFFDLDDEGLNMELLLFSQQPAAETDNDPISVADNELAKLECSILIDTWRDLIDNQVGVEDNLGIAYTAPKRELWAQWVSRGAPTIAATAIPLWSMIMLADE